MTTKYFVYIHSRPDGTPFYVGKGTMARAYAFKAPRRNPHYKNIIAKYGQDFIRVELIECESEEHAFRLEMETIAKMRAAGVDVVNMTDGGEGTSGFTQPDHVRKAVAKANAERIVTEDQRRRVSQKMKGRVVSQESIEKVRQKLIGRKRPQHVIDALVEANRGKTLSEERRSASAQQLAKVREKAAEWHSSPEGLAWHAAHGKASWASRESFKCVCQVCGKEFMSPFPTRAKYCHQNCKQTALRQRRKGEEE